MSGRGNAAAVETPERFPQRLGNLARGRDSHIPTAEELQKRVQELDTYLEEFRQKHTVADLQQFTEADSQRTVEEVFWRAMRVVGYIDALIKKTPLDRTLYEQAAGRMVVFNQLERSLVYLEPLARLFEEERATSLRTLAAVERQLSKKYFDIGDDEIGERLQKLDGFNLS